MHRRQKLQFIQQEIQSGISVWDFSLEMQFGNTVWDFSLEMQFGNTVWDFSLGYSLEMQSGKGRIR